MSTNDFKELLQIHEFSTYVVPGLVFLFFLTFIYQESLIWNTDSLSIGSLVILLILSYAAGHMVQSVGNIIEKTIFEPICRDLKTEKKGSGQRIFEFLHIDKLIYPKHIEKYEVTDEKVKIFKAHGKIRRGLATSFLLLLFISFLAHAINYSNQYLVWIAFVLVLFLFVYMRAAEKRELGIK